VKNIEFSREYDGHDEIPLMSLILVYGEKSSYGNLCQWPGFINHFSSPPKVTFTLTAASISMRTILIDILLILILLVRFKFDNSLHIDFQKR
jgi:hypothetical protein